MSKMKPQKKLLQLVMLALLSVVSVLVTSNESFAALQCYNCHGNNVNDSLPLDTPPGSPASYRNITTGAVKGNHQTHLNGLNITTANQSMCARCHNNSGYTSSHRSGTITLNKSINASPATTNYVGAGMSDGGTFLFKNQTSVPTLGSCSNVNCHFEAATPTWGADPATVTCSTCHAATPATGSHPRHLDVVSHATYTCNNCHAPRTTFQHATSAGNVGRNIDLKGTSMTGAFYSLSNFQYLPSQSATRQFGQCDNLYCHSTGQGNGGVTTWAPAASAPIWNNPGSAGCGTCHASNLLNTGSHSKHIARDSNCGNCHTGATLSTMVSTTHVDGNIDVVGSQAVGYSQGASSPRGNGYGTCNNATCHSTTTAAAPVTPTWAVAATCASCHALVPATGSHVKHVTTTLYNLATCGDCHTGATAGSNGGAGHFDNNINVSAGMGYNTVIAKHAVGNYTTGGSCSTAYCHSSGQSANGLSSVPVYGAAVTWGSTVACGSCHATSTLATGSHSEHLAANTNCGNCHTGASLASYNSTNHINTNIDVAATVNYNAGNVRGNGYGQCSAASCHSNGRGVIVPTPTWGSATAACTACHALVPNTGSHTKHLQAFHQVTPILDHRVSCESCHTGYVQGTTAGPGHLDNNIDVTVGSYPANKTINTAFATCSNVSCHNAPGATPAFVGPAVTWGTALNCAGCHGYPPVNSNHSGVLAGTCNSCHSEVSPGGSVSNSTFAQPQLHMDGKVDGGNCNSCHGYPPVQSMAGNGTNASYSSARMQNYSGGGGVHAVAGHLPKNLKVSQNLSFSPCLTCHPQGSTHNEGFGAFSTHHVQVLVDVKFKFDKNRPIVYNGVRSVGSTKATGTCTNVECHFQKSPVWSTQTYTKRH